MTKHRYLARLAALGMAGMAISSPACPGPGSELYVIGSAPPANVPPDLAVLEVEMPEADPRAEYWPYADDGLRVRVIRVVQGSYRYRFVNIKADPPTSCTRPGTLESRGFVTGRLGTADKRRTIKAVPQSYFPRLK